MLLESLESRRLLASIEVTTLLDRVRDDGETSLREAVASANQFPGRDEITFAQSLFSGGAETITLNDDNPVTQLQILESVDIVGPGADTLTIDADQLNRHFLISSGDLVSEFITATISGLTLTGGQTTTGGGSIFVRNADVTIIDSEITLSTAPDDGGGVVFIADNSLATGSPNSANAKLTVLGTTIANNSSGDNGGGISVLGLNTTARLRIQNSTISNNLADDDGGGVFFSETDSLLRHVTITGNHGNNDDTPSLIEDSQVNAITLKNTIVAGNFTGSGTLDPDDLAAPVEVGSINNLIGDPDSSGGLVDGVNGNIVGTGGNGRLPIRQILDIDLELNEGTTRTHALADDSPAIDAAAILLPPVTVDQRGVSRPQGPASDIGAFETRVNTAPAISDIADQTVEASMPTPLLMFTVSDAETAVDELVVTATSSNATLVPQTGIVPGGSGADRTIIVTPRTNQIGTATITVTVTDEGGLTATDTFEMVVTAANTAPTIGDIANQTVTVNTPIPELTFAVADLETAAGDLAVTATSSNTTLVPQTGVQLAGSGADRTIIVTPAMNETGTTTITVTVTDEGGLTATDTFEIVVNAANTAPTIGDIADQTVSVNAATPELAFTVGDLETAVGDLIVTATSSDTALVPQTGIQLAGSGADRTITVTPATDQTGTTTITVTVTDESGLSATDTFEITVDSEPVAVIRSVGPGGAPDPPDLPGGPQPTSWATQRSDLREIVIELAAPISTPTASDLVLTNLGVDAPADSNVMVPLSDSQLSLSPDGLVLTISFSANQLEDGVYQLELLPSITGGAQVTITGDAVNQLFVLTGDWNGSGGINIQDFATFAYWFGTSLPTAPDYVDPNASSGINIQDFAAFAANFGKSLTFPGASSKFLASDHGHGEGESGSAFETQTNQLDVNGDGWVTARDAIDVFDEIARGDSGDSSKHDANQDGLVTPLDALVVINRLSESGATDRRFAIPQNAQTPATDWNDSRYEGDELEQIIDLLLNDRLKSGLV